MCKEVVRGAVRRRRGDVAPGDVDGSLWPGGMTRPLAATLWLIGWSFVLAVARIVAVSMGQIQGGAATGVSVHFVALMSLGLHLPFLLLTSYYCSIGGTRRGPSDGLSQEESKRVWRRATFTQAVLLVLLAIGLLTEGEWRGFSLDDVAEGTASLLQALVLAIVGARVQVALFRSDFLRPAVRRRAVRAALGVAGVGAAVFAVRAIAFIGLLSATYDYDPAVKVVEQVLIGGGEVVALSSALILFDLQAERYPGGRDPVRRVGPFASSPVARPFGSIS
jgi:hypothetical protein